MLSNKIKQEIKTLWDDYLLHNKRVLDKTGKEFENIDDKRLIAIEDIKSIIQSFMLGDSDIYSFKTALDSYNKRNNLWGFTAIKGQMFFNQLVRSYSDNIDDLTNLLKSIINEPKDLKDALKKIEKLENELIEPYFNAPDKRKVPKPSSVGYFLSYFWQIHNPKKWAILFSSMISTYKELGIWEYKETQKETFEYFYLLNKEIKQFLEKETKTEITYWGIEHCFWDLHIKNLNEDKKIEKIEKKVVKNEEVKTLIQANFDINDYLIPKVSRLIELGEDDSKSASKKGSLFEKKVSEIFKLLDFDVKEYGQGTGRNADAILKFREENTAFIVDAKAYSNGYNLGLDDRAIREYINFYSPKLIKDGYKKIGFIIVSNSFKSDFETFINDVTWNTNIKRFILLTSNALLHLLAYKTKDNIPVNQIIDTLIKLGTVITEKEIIGEFEDI